MTVQEYKICFLNYRMFDIVKNQRINKRKQFISTLLGVNDEIH